MPYKKRYRSKSRRRTRKFRRKKRNYVPRINRPMSNTLICKLRYADQIELNPTGSGGGVQYAFRANSVFDPDYTGVGHQCLGYDQITPFFQHYVVLGAKITAKFMTTDNVVYNEFVTCSLVDTLPSLSTISTYIENKRGTYGVIGAANGGKPVVTLTAKYSAKKFFHVKDPAGDSRLVASTANNPTEDALFMVGAQAMGTGDPSTMNIMIVIDYIVKFLEPRVLAQS